MRVRRIAPGHLHTPLGGAGDQTGDLLVTSQSTQPPELLSSQMFVCFVG